MTVSEVKEHLQEVDYWYSNTDVNITMKGYVVEIATVFASSYNNISLYIVDEDFCAGYYLYRVGCDQATADRLVPGAPVIVTGTTNTNYNGLIETNAGGQIVIDEDREAINIEETVHALDNEVIGGLFSANYHQSSLVSLTNWKVVEVKTAPSAASSTETLFVLEKAGVKVAVIVSKYHEGSYTRTDDNSVWKALCEHGVQEGDIVSVKGVLGNYKNSHQIAVRSINDIVKGGTADAEGTVYPGIAAGEAVEAIDAALVAGGLTAPVVATEKAVEIPTIDGVEISARVLGGNAIEVEDGVLFVTPGKLENACVRFDITVGEFSTAIFRYIKSADLDDLGKVELEGQNLKLDIDAVTKNTTLELPTEGSLFEGVTIAWSFKEGTTHDCATLEGNVLTVTLPAEATSITIVATLTLGEASTTVEFGLNVSQRRALENKVTGADLTSIPALNEIGAAQAHNTYTTDSYLVIGYVDEIANATYGNIYIVDAEGNRLYVYGVNDIAGKKYGEMENKPVAGDVVVLYGPMGQYNGTAQMKPGVLMQLNDTVYANVEGEGGELGTLGTIVLTTTSLNLTASKYQDGSAVVNGVTFDFVELGYYDNGLQWRHKAETGKTTKIWNSTELPGGIVSIKIVLNAAKGAYDNTDLFAFNFGTSATNLTSSYLLSTVKGQLEYTIVPDANTYTFFSMAKNMLQYSNYIDSITITVNGEVEEEHQHTYVWTDLGDGTCSAVCSGDSTHTVAAQAHVDTDLNGACDNCSATVELPEPILAPADGTYKMYLVQTTLGKKLYWDGNSDDREYFTLTENADDAVVVTIAKVGENAYTIKLGEKFVEIYVQSNGTSLRPTLVDASTQSWAWDETAGVFTWNITEKVVYLGTYGTYNTISVSETWRITGSNLSAIGSSQFICQYEAASAPECSHVFANACDNECDLCGEPNPDYVAGHVYDNACDAVCNECEEARTPADHVDAEAPKCVCDVCEAALDHVDTNSDNKCDNCETNIIPLCTGDHTYTDECDAECDACPFVREDAPHKFENACDGECECGATRTPADHVDTAEADCKCDVCDAALEHKYDNACDADCNVCGESRTPAEHVFDNNCDADCNVCGTANPDYADHADLDSNSKCDECGAVVTAHAGTEADPYSVADSLLVAGELAQGAYTEKVFITGVIKSIGSTGSYLKNVYIVDTEDSTKEILVFSVNFTAGVVDSVAVGDTVTINGYLTNYYGTLEVTSYNGDYAYFTACTPHTCDMSEATCLEAATCSICGKVDGEALGHTDEENSDGLCDRCGKSMSAPVEASLGKVTFGASTNTNKTGGYTAALTTVANGITLTSQNFNSNNNEWAYIRCGRKSDPSVATISTGAMSQTITKVVVTIDSVLDASKVNSFKLIVATDASFTNVVETINGTIGTGAKTFNITNPQAGLYYQIVFDCSAHGSKNGIVQVSGVEFFGYNA